MSVFLFLETLFLLIYHKSGFSQSDNINIPAIINKICFILALRRLADFASMKNCCYNINNYVAVYQSTQSISVHVLFDFLAIPYIGVCNLIRSCDQNIKGQGFPNL